MLTSAGQATWRRYGTVAGGAAVVGAIFGMVSLVPDTRDESLPTIISVILNAALVWGGFAFVVGAATAKKAQTWWCSALSGLIAMGCAIVAYYLLDVVLRENAQSVLNIDDLVGYGREALVAGPILGALGWWWARSPTGTLGALALVVGQLYLSAEEIRGALSMQADGYHSDSDVEPIVANGILIGVGGTLLVILLQQWRVRRVRSQSVRL